jgi:endonuclease/exonuclease/phosphatase family metal-dependent hydrolase
VPRIRLLLLLLVTVPACGSSHFASATAPDNSSTLRLVTWNLKQSSGSTVELQADLLARAAPDVVVLQEAYRGQVDRIRRLLEERTTRTWESRYAPAVRRSDGNQGAGVIALSSWPIVESDVLMMEHADRWTAARPALRIRIRPPSGPDVDVVTTHLAAGEDAASVRAAQLRELISWTQRSGTRSVIGGDLNAPPSAPELAALRASFVDVWATLAKAGGETFSAERPERRIDYWFVARGAGLEPADASVIDACARGACVSDHHALLAILRLPSR